MVDPMNKSLSSVLPISFWNYWLNIHINNQVIPYSTYLLFDIPSLVLNPPVTKEVPQHSHALSSSDITWTYVVAVETEINASEQAYSEHQCPHQVDLMDARSLFQRLMLNQPLRLFLLPLQLETKLNSIQKRVIIHLSHQLMTLLINKSPTIEARLIHMQDRASQGKTLLRSHFPLHPRVRWRVCSKAPSICTKPAHSMNDTCLATSNSQSKHQTLR